jgi:predicted nucleotidyltransferase component of viral defense system
MNLLDLRVDSALIQLPALEALRPVVEKEILHHEILRVMSRMGYLNDLVFMGGTCLRDVYGSPRLSEDLDFAGGAKFDKSNLSDLGSGIGEAIQQKYGFPVTVTEPTRDSGDTSTWKIRVITRPERPDLPIQRIHIDICALPGHDRQPAVLQQHYGGDMGTAGLILYAESRQEILADKIVDLALRRSQVKYRDIWDILYLLQHGVSLDRSLVHRKLADRAVERTAFMTMLRSRVSSLGGAWEAYQQELRRLLPTDNAATILQNPVYWQYALSRLTDLVAELNITTTPNS